MNVRHTVWKNLLTNNPILLQEESLHNVKRVSSEFENSMKQQQRTYCG